MRNFIYGGYDEWDFWIKASRIESYLESLGFSRAENKVVLKTKLALAQNRPLAQHDSGMSLSDETPQRGLHATQKAPPVPYGSKALPGL